jgi:hypothetical protein
MTQYAIGKIKAYDECVKEVEVGTRDSESLGRLNKLRSGTEAAQCGL